MKNKKGMKVRISNYRTLVKEDRFIYYTAPSFVKKSDFKESFHAVGKILLNRRNYCLIKITQDDRQRKVLKVSEEWKIEKIILSWLINIIIHSKKISKKFQKNFPLVIRRGRVFIWKKN